MCNGKCIICPHEKLYKSYIEMSDKDIESIIKYARTNNVKRLIPYLNNEPFIDKRMITILKNIKASQIEVEISTNLSKISYQELDLIFKENLIDDFRISFFGGTKSVYNKMMPGLDYYENLKKLTYIFENYSDRNIEVCMVLYPQIDIYKEAKYLESIIKNIKIRFFGYLDRGGNNKLKNNLLIEEETSYKVVGCTLNREKERICITASGNCVLCSQDWNENHIYGNIKNNSIKSIWNSKKRELNINKISGNLKMDNKFLCKKCKISLIEFENKKKLNFKGDCYVTEEGNKIETNWRPR